jgi:hypothetical protein
MFALGSALRETGQVLDRIGCSMQGSNAFREAISKHRTVLGIYDKVPTLPMHGFVAPSASVMGNVSIGEKSSVWYGAVLRGRGVTHSREPSYWLHGPRRLSSTGALVVTPGGCQIGNVDHTGCHKLVLWLSLPGVTRLVTWTILAVVN